MSRLLVLTTTELAIGYHVAGAATIEVGSLEQAVAALEDLLVTEDGVIAMHAPYFHALPPPIRARLDAISAPLVVPLPAGDVLGQGGDRRERLLELLRQAVGYQISFGDQEGTP